MKSYPNPKAFADHLKTIYFSEILKASAEDRTKRDAFIKSFYKDSIDDKYDEVNTRYQRVIDLLLEKDFYRVLPSWYKEFVQAHFYFSTIETEQINAKIFRSPDKQFFAIFINTSLIDLLTKVGKLDCATIYPDSVTYCNRTQGRIPTLQELQSMRAEYFERFSLYKVPYGPYLVLTPEASAIHFDALTIKERFLLFHEFAHFLNGDFFNNCKALGDAMLATEIENAQHRKEYFADLVAFYLLLKTEKEHNSISYERRVMVLFSIIALFDIFFLLNSDETSSHPHPLRRLYGITEHFFGTAIADAVHATYTDKSQEAVTKILFMEKELDSLEDDFAPVVEHLIIRSTEKKILDTTNINPITFLQ